jgi:hypothetical protein
MNRRAILMVGSAVSRSDAGSEGTDRDHRPALPLWRPCPAFLCCLLLWIRNRCDVAGGCATLEVARRRAGCNGHRSPRQR